MGGAASPQNLVSLALDLQQRKSVGLWPTKKEVLLQLKASFILKEVRLLKIQPGLCLSFSAKGFFCLPVSLNSTQCGGFGA